MEPVCQGANGRAMETPVHQECFLMRSSRFSSLRPLALSALFVLANQATAGDLPAAERDVTPWLSSSAQRPRVDLAQANPAATPPGNCSFPGWVPGVPYGPLSIVTYGSQPYFAKYENPGYIPTVSTYFWGPYSCPVSAAPPARCTYTEWMQDWPYQAGNVVSYQGKFYAAKHDNPGYTPTVSTYYWAPHDCGASTMTTTSSEPQQPAMTQTMSAPANR